MATAAVPPPFEAGDGYKYQWARYIARKTLQDDLETITERIREMDNTPENLVPGLGAGKLTIEQLALNTRSLTGSGIIPPDPYKFKIGIVGAGVAGLFSGMMFDWLNQQMKGRLHIDYEILEAAGEERMGGRLFTWNFSPAAHDYYDVGAMRFPENKVMKRTFDLFDFLDMKKKDSDDGKHKAELLRYYLADDHNVCPAYFNDVHTVGRVFPKATDNAEERKKYKVDPYKLNEGLPKDARIPVELVSQDPSDIMKAALDPFTQKAKKLLIQQRANQDGSSSEETQFWKLLMAADSLSVRQFLSTITVIDVGTEKITIGRDYNYNTIEWLETASYGTGWFDQSLSEAVLEELDFEVEDGQEYWCVDGGTQKVARKMWDMVVNKPKLHSRVVAIDAHVEERSKKRAADEYTPMTLSIKYKDPNTNCVAERKEDYFAVFNSTTLGALQQMNLKDAGLLWGTKQAIRALGYSASCKVAIRFKTPWWQKKPFFINEGGVSRTDLPLRVCVYPSYNIEKVEGKNWNPDGPSVLLCSYTWGQDAQRIGSLTSPRAPGNRQPPESEERLKEMLLHNLALLHANESCPYEELLATLKSQYDTHHAFDWYQDQNMAGAFAYFGPGQFSNMWQEIIKPNAFGQLALIGEAASSHHAWIVGALESVVRAVYVLLEGLDHHRPDPVYKEAMRLLEVGPNPLKDSIPNPEEPHPPFWPLPSEMPKRQWDTDRKTEPTDELKEGKGVKGEEPPPLTYAAAVAVMSVIESYFELLGTELQQTA